MATVLERVPVGEVRAEAQDIKFGVTALTIVTAVFVALGWLMGVLWAAFAWSFAAVKVGFRQGRQVGLVSPTEASP